VQEVVCEIFFDNISLIATANDEVVNAMGGVELHDVPEDGFTSDFNHGLWLEMRLFRNAGAEATGKDDCFHFLGRLVSWMAE